MGRLVNKAELAEILDLSQTTLTVYQEEGLPIQQRGERGLEHSYDTAAVIDWLIQRALARVGTPRSQIELEILQLDLKKKRAEDALREGSLVPADQVEPAWTGFALTAAAYMTGRASGLAAELEIQPGIEAKRAALLRSDRQFLTHLGTHGERMQVALEAFLARLPTADVQALFRTMSQEAAIGA